MTEDDAVEIAKGYMTARGVSYETVLSTRHITADLLDDLRRQAAKGEGVRPPSEEIYERMREGYETELLDREL